MPVERSHVKTMQLAKPVLQVKDIGVCVRLDLLVPSVNLVRNILSFSVNVFSKLYLLFIGRLCISLVLLRFYFPQI